MVHQTVSPRKRVGSMAINSNICSHCFTFTLMMTGALSQNIGKLFSELTDNLLFICVSGFWLYTITVYAWTCSFPDHEPVNVFQSPNCCTLRMLMLSGANPLQGVLLTYPSLWLPIGDTTFLIWNFCRCGIFNLTFLHKTLCCSPSTEL